MGSNYQLYLARVTQNRSRRFDSARLLIDLTLTLGRLRAEPVATILGRPKPQGFENNNLDILQQKKTTR